MRLAGFYVQFIQFIHFHTLPMRLAHDDLPQRCLEAGMLDHVEKVDAISTSAQKQHGLKVRSGHVWALLIKWI